MAFKLCIYMLKKNIYTRIVGMSYDQEYPKTKQTLFGIWNGECFCWSLSRTCVKHVAFNDLLQGSAMPKISQVLPKQTMYSFLKLSLRRCFETITVWSGEQDPTPKSFWSLLVQLNSLVLVQRRPARQSFWSCGMLSWVDEEHIETHLDKNGTH